MAVDNIDNIVYCWLYYFWRVILAPIGILPTQNRQYSGEDNIDYIALYSKYNIVAGANLNIDAKYTYKTARI